VLEFNSFVARYEPAVLALLLVFAYFIVVTLILRALGPQQITVPQYEPPLGASPGVAAWLLERGKISRAMATTLVSMAAKRVLQIEQSEDVFSLTKLETEMKLEPEEDILARSLFRDYDSFDFDQTTPQLTEAVTAFRWPLRNTGYLSANTALFIPAWIVSGLATLFVLTRGNYSLRFSRDAGAYFAAIILITFGCFVVAVRTLPGTFEKIASRLPGSTAPRRPWTGTDTRPVTFLLVTIGGVALLALLSTTVSALLTAAFMAINAVFFHAMQGPTPAGRRVLAQLADYRKFLSEVDADRISRVNSSEHVPAQLRLEDAYALAFHLDPGWGEQFLTSIADLIESAEVFPVLKGLLYRREQ
jgi:hypothetical protein